MSFSFLNFWLKPVNKADNHGNPEKCGNTVLLVYICAGEKKCALIIYPFIPLSLGI